MNLDRITREDFEIILTTLTKRIGRLGHVFTATGPAFCPDSDVEQEQHDGDDNLQQQVDNIFVNKIGGYPYIPPDTTKEDYATYGFVCQFRCEDLYLMHQEYPHFPRTGLLQFFLSEEVIDPKIVDYHGTIIKYHEFVDENVTLEQVKEKFALDQCEYNGVQQNQCQFIKFVTKPTINLRDEAYVGVEMMKEIQNFYKLDGEKRKEQNNENDDGDNNNDDDENNIDKNITLYGCAFGYDDVMEKFVYNDPTAPYDVPSNVGGVYGWTQSDVFGGDCDDGEEEQEPPAAYVTRDNMVRLLFLNSNNPNSDEYPIDCMMWGDLGTVLWVISAENLAKRDWAKHFFYTDCY